MGKKLVFLPKAVPIGSRAENKVNKIFDEEQLPNHIQLSFENASQCIEVFISPIISRQDEHSKLQYIVLITVNVCFPRPEVVFGG